MPRVKALTTGSVPSFLDLILNFAESDTSSSLATQDTWLAQLRRRGQGKEDEKVVFYGDDTWLKLFPGDFFGRSEGTSSFFVSVSRHTLYYTHSRAAPPAGEASTALSPAAARCLLVGKKENPKAKYRSFLPCRISLKSTTT